MVSAWSVRCSDFNQLEAAYSGYINRYIFPKEYEEYSGDDYYDYKIQCAFRVAYKVLEGEKK